MLLQSTLMMALWRIVERESGSITIDGIDTLTIGLQDLRTCLALVPQVIFTCRFAISALPLSIKCQNSPMLYIVACL